MTLSLEDFSRCCRCCLTVGRPLTPIFGVSLDDMLMKLINLQITENDQYPQQICSRCVIKLSSAHNFYLTVMRSHKTLEDIFKATDETGELLENEDNYEENKLNRLENDIDTLENMTYGKHSSPIQEESIEIDTINNDECNILNESSSKDSTYNEEYQCSQCFHTSKDRENFKVHIQSHLGVEDLSEYEDKDAFAHMCNYCGVRYRWRTSLHKHMRQHRGLYHQCPHCPKRYGEASSLNVHLASHSLDGSKRFHCKECERSFTQLSSLNKHKQNHNAQRVQCQQCGKGFLHQYSLQRHCKRVHSPSECPRCNKLFSGKKFLNAHMRSHIQNEMANTKIIEEFKLTEGTISDSINIQTVTVEFLCLICSQKFQTRESLEVHMCVNSEIT